MNIKIACSLKTDIKENLKDIQNQLVDVEKKVILFFSSSSFDPQKISIEFKNTFPDTETFGCSTSGEITSGKVLKNSIVAMAFDSKSIGKFKIEILEKIKSNNNIKTVFDSFEKFFNIPTKKMDIKKYFGIILIDGLSGCEEKIMDQIGDCTNVFFIGGSAGDDLKFKNTYIYSNGKTYEEAALLVLFEPDIKFDFIKTQSFCELNNKLIATKVNEEKREVIEFNNKPAITAYAEAIGKSEKEAADNFMTHPVGLMINGEPYVRSPQQINGKSMIFYCNVIKGMELSLLQSTNIINDTKSAIQNKIKENGKITAIINFNCILRTLELEKLDKTEEYGKIFSDIPTIGFSTYGEQFIGHINQTATMLVFL
jgi:hypothetical protein